MKRISVLISTKDRKFVLHQVLWSLRNQTYPWWDVVIIDDSDTPFKLEDWANDEMYSRLIKELQFKHKVHVMSSPKNGKLGASFQAGFHYADKEWRNQIIFRCDDDVWFEPNYFEILIKVFDDPEVGAAAGLMLDPGNNIQYMGKEDPRYKQWNTVATITHDPNLQWIRHEDPTPFPVEYLHSCQAIRTDVMRRINGFDTALFDYHREENHLSWRVFVEGYKVMIVPKAEAWHLRAPSGGTRGRNSWIDDSRKFSLIKKSMAPGIHISLSHAIGDLIMATPMVREMKKKYPDRNISIWHPYAKEVFKDNPYIDEIAKGPFDAQRTFRIEESIYSWAATNDWTGHLVQAYCKMCGLPETEDMFPELYGIDPIEGESNYVIITPQSNAKIFDFSDYSETKCWPHERWDELISWLKDTYGVEVIHLCGEEVPETFEGTRLINDVDFRTAFSWIAGSRCLISIDTMAVHAAAALNVPIVALWGRTSPVMYGYERDNIINLYGQCPTNFACFGGALYQQDRSKCPAPDHPCMNHSIDDVRQAISSVILDSPSSFKLPLHKSKAKKEIEIVEADEDAEIEALERDLNIKKQRKASR